MSQNDGLYFTESLEESDDTSNSGTSLHLVPRPIIYSINPTIIDRRRHNRSVWVTLNGANFNKEIFECAVINVDENLQYKEAERTIVEHEISSNSTAKCLVDVSSIQLSHYLVAISTD